MSELNISPEQAAAILGIDIPEGASFVGGLCSMIGCAHDIFDCANILSVMDGKLPAPAIARARNRTEHLRHCQRAG